MNNRDESSDTSVGVLERSTNASVRNTSARAKSRLAEKVAYLPNSIPTDDYNVLNSHEARLLQQYATHGLSDLDNAKLMNRVDSKFVIPRALLPDLLRRMRDHYSALEIDGKRIFGYLNTYYDSEDFTHYLAHHNGKLNRFKIRRRTYLDTDTSFLEVKFKNNKKRTLKSRVQLAPEERRLSEEASHFLARSGLEDHLSLHPVQTGSYHRIALASEERSERLTIDCNLAFHDLTEKRSFAVGPWVVLELKQARMNRTGPFFSWARENGMRKSSFSKYCMGVYFTGSQSLKRNNFHSIARKLKIEPTAMPSGQLLKRRKSVTRNSAKCTKSVHSSTP